MDSAIPLVETEISITSPGAGRFGVDSQLLGSIKREPPSKLFPIRISVEKSTETMLSISVSTTTPTP